MRLREPLPCPSKLTSQQTTWNGVRFQYYVKYSHETSEHSMRDHLVSIPCSKPFILDWKIENRFQSNQIDSGDILFCPSQLSRQLRWHSEIKFVNFYLQPEFIAQTAYETFSINNLELLPVLKRQDLLVHHIGLTLKNEITMESYQCPVYQESLLNALIIHLIAKYSSYQPIIRDYQSGLSRATLNNVIGFINESLDEELKLTELAGLADMSQYHFCRLFKKSTGMTPHQYIIQQRIEKAKILLIQNKLTIADIAQLCGFSNQSHFSATFRRFTGVTPRSFRQQHLT